MTPAVFVDAMRRVRAVLEEAEDAGIGLMQHEAKWQRIDPKDRATWPPLFKTVLASDRGGFPALASFSTEDERLIIHCGNWEGKVYDGWSFFVFPAPPRGGK